MTVTRSRSSKRYAATASTSATTENVDDESIEKDNRNGKGNGKDSDNLKEPLHRTVAVSDAFMAACAWYSASRIDNSGAAQYVQIGFSCFGLACSAGVLRFGFNPECFRPYNEVLAKIAGRVGIPLLAFVASEKHINYLPLPMLFALCVLSACSNVWSVRAQELYTLILGVVSNGFLVAYGVQEKETGAFAGAALFVLGGLVIGPDRNRCLFGVRRENLFHYCLGTALLLIGEHVARKGSWKMLL